MGEYQMSKKKKKIRKNIQILKSMNFLFDLMKL